MLSACLITHTLIFFYIPLQVCALISKIKVDFCMYLVKSPEVFSAAPGNALVVYVFLSLIVPFVLSLLFLTKGSLSVSRELSSPTCGQT